MANRFDRQSTPALKVKQWNSAWDDITWNRKEHRSEPPHYFYQFNLPAGELRRLSGVYERTTNRKTAADDFGIQRQLNKERSSEISRFVEFGYPWSDLSRAKRSSPDFRDLRQPGWLPTSVVVNTLVSGNRRRGKTIDDADLIEIVDEDEHTATLSLPHAFSNLDWKPSSIAPLEVIDGQHRLWAFDEIDLQDEYELPVVAFVGLDLSWQAYLFYIINIKPKKINASLAFDLYPLLRTEQWLEKFEGHAIYRETRSQEIVDKLWSHEQSPWHHRINMLGASGSKGLMVTQSAWVRSLMASFVKIWEGRRVRIGGIYGAKVGEHETVLPWTFAEQAAVLIFVGRQLQESIENSDELWSRSLRKKGDADDDDLAFFGANNLLNQDQGIRTLLQIFNDFLFLNSDSLSLEDLFSEHDTDDSEETDARIEHVVDCLYEAGEVTEFVDHLALILSTYDWRASSSSDLTNNQRVLKASFRGSGGYKELRRHVLLHISKNGGSTLASDADTIMEILDYTR